MDKVLAPSITDISRHQRFWSLHSHSRYSKGDALPSVSRIVAQAVELEYPALAITDHGTISGAVQHYRACRAAGIEPLIGVEAYIAFDRRTALRPKLHHALLVAFNETGYRNLVALTTTSWRQHNWYPTLDLDNLATAASQGRLDGLLMTSGCWFGLMPKLLRENPSEHLLNVFEALSSWFDGRFFVEIHNHRISETGQDDSAQALLLHQLSKSLGLPSVLMQDNHYVHLSERPLHDAFKMLTSYKTNDPSDAVFPGDGYHMVDTKWMRAHHQPHVFKRGMEGLALVQSWAELRIPELETYRLRTPDLSVTGSAYRDLETRVRKRLDDRLFEQDWSNAMFKKYRKRLNEELEIIRKTGFAGYMLLVAKVAAWMIEQGIRFTVRGSAAGSLIIWLLDITSIDPLHWGLSFDRFLSVDRVKPPDVDLDIEHERRDEVIARVLEMFDSAQIGTFAQYGLSEKDNGNPGGLLMVDWKARARAFGADPNAPIPDEWRARLKAIAMVNGSYGNGSSVDPPLRSIGVHAAGVLIAPDAAALEQVPLQRVSSSKTIVTAFDQHDVDHLGLVKLDLLGLRTLTTLRVCEEMTGIRFDELATNDRKVFAEISKDTVGLFQLEGGSSTRGIKRMKPTKIADVIAAMALFRPAAINSGATDSYLKRRSGAEVIKHHHPLIDKHLEGTYGVIVYQEQVLGILKDIGLTVAEVELARKAIKASNANISDASETLKGLMTTINNHAAVDHGMSPVDRKWLEDALYAYAEYGFNQAHATAYGLIAYATGWYRLYRPVAFWTGVLRANHDAPAKYKDAPTPETIYLAAARRAGLQVLPAHVNVSGASYSSDGRHLYRGLTSIKGIGREVATVIAANAPYSSLNDFARRLPTKVVTGTRALGKGTEPINCPGVVRMLHEAGALTDLERESTTKESNESGVEVQSAV